MKKKDLFKKKNIQDWESFTKNLDTLPDKDAFLLQQNNPNKIKKLDLHGFSLDEANQEVKKFIINSHKSGCNKLIIITGKGTRSKNYQNPYTSNEMGVLKNSIPEFITKDSDLASIVNNLSKAEVSDGGDGAIYVDLKKL